MTKKRHVTAPQLLNPQSRRVLAGVTTTSAEDAVLLAGVQAADVALEQSRSSGVLKVFMEVWHSDSTTPRLTALRAYAELRRVLLQEGYDVPASSLVAVGFTAAQIARFNSMIATKLSGTRKVSAASKSPAQSEIVQ